MFLPLPHLNSQFSMIEKSNNRLQQTFKKMHELEEEWQDALFCATMQVNSQMMEHLGCSPVKIISKIQPFISIKLKNQIHLLPIKLKFLVEEQVSPLVSDYIGQRNNIREDGYNRLVKKKE